MKIQELFSQIGQEEPYNYLKVFFEDHGSFEELPLVSRYKKTSKLR